MTTANVPTWGPDAWKPRHRKDATGRRIFCSPACGANCSYFDYQQAQRRALKLANRLGPGWKPRVWENMGWFCEAVKGKASVHPHYTRGRKTPRYTIYFNTHIQVVLAGPSPSKLVKQALEIARANIREQVADIRAVEV